MPTYKKSFVLTIPFEDALSVCRSAGAAMGLKVEQHAGLQSGGRPNALLVLKKPMGWTSSAMRVEVIIQAEGSSRSMIAMEGYKPGQILGGAPGYIKKWVDDVGETIRTTARDVRPPNQAPGFQDPSSLASEIEALAKLQARGILSDEEFQRGKHKLLNG